MKHRTFLAVVLVVLTSLVFWRHVRDSFDLTKATILWIGSVPIWSSAVIERIRRGEKVSVARYIHWWILGAALCVATFSASRVGYAIVGQPARFTGLLTLLSVLLVGGVIASEFGVKPIQSILITYSWTSILVATYVFVQAIGDDPFDWVTTSFGTPVFGTIGNPNTASGFLAICGVMSLWVLHQSEIPKRLRMVSAVALGMVVGSMPLLVSFQGQIVIALGGLLWILRAVVTRSVRSAALLVEVSLASSLVIVSLAPSRTWLFPVTTLGVPLGVALLWIVDSRVSHPTQVERGRRLRLISGILGLVGAIVILTPARGIIVDGISGGLLERGDFYRSAFGVFKAHPILGGGFENFGFEFPSFRPEGHAIRLENSRPSSVHSIPLAMLSSGGVLLGAAYLTFIVIIGVRAFNLRKASSLFDPNVYWLLALWICANLQSTVSVEHVSLYLQFFLIAGLIEAASRTAISQPMTSRRKKPVRSEGINLVVAAALTTLLAVPLSRPFRANSMALDATVKLLDDGDRNLAIESYEKVVRLSPWDFYYRYELGFMVFQSGDGQRGADLLLQAAQDSNYIAPIAIPAATALAQMSRLEEAAQVLLNAVDRDPYAPSLRRQTADYLTQMGDAFVGVSDSANAQIFFRRALEVVPDYGRARDGLASLEAAG